MPRQGQFKKGIYRPDNPEKYKGVRQPVYRSSYELKFMRFLDKTDAVVEWCSEGLAIGYIHPLTGRPARYFPDFLIKYRTGPNQYEIDLIEVKPKRETEAPKTHGNKKAKTILYEKKTWAVNQAKWKAAKDFCNKRDINFRLITEKELNIFSR